MEENMNLNLAGKNLISPMDLSVDEMNFLFDLAEKIIANPQEFCETCKGALLATLFFEPSTRTRLSFEAAMQRLGGRVIGFSEPSSTSVSKGESLADTIRTIASYADIAVMRHPKEGAALVAAAKSEIPIINAGDGGHFHPTQTLTDLLTIRLEKGGFGGITIGLCGDLKFGRTVHSLICAFARYSGVKFVLISPDELRIPEYVRDEISDYEEVRDLREALPRLDVLYMTRVQRERFFNEEDYIRLKDSYILNAAKLKDAKENLMILHPLPRVNEISADVDDDPRAFYFRQMKNGMYIRMALLAALLGRI
jgi:aspartate carbamoyltransferase catalytic subunit